jgi:protein-tyrosine phosphatase
VSEIFWIKGKPEPNLAIVLCPLGGDGLEGALLGLKQGGIETLISLLEVDEAAMLGVAEEGALASQLGMQFIPYPIPDAHVPADLKSFRVFVSGLADRLRAGEHLGVHCRGSIGRATITAACTLIHLGWKPQTALTAIVVARGLAVPDTQEQENWILAYEAQP